MIRLSLPLLTALVVVLWSLFVGWVVGVLMTRRRCRRLHR
jgi:hypothetical protein